MRLTSLLRSPSKHSAHQTSGARRGFAVRLHAPSNNFANLVGVESDVAAFALYNRVLV